MFIIKIQSYRHIGKIILKSIWNKSLKLNYLWHKSTNPLPISKLVLKKLVLTFDDDSYILQWAYILY